MLYLPVCDAAVAGGCTVQEGVQNFSCVLHCEAAAGTAFEAAGLIYKHFPQLAVGSDEVMCACGTPNSPTANNWSILCFFDV